MVDIFSKDKRSNIMSRVKGKNTKPELMVRTLLHKMGYRFRLHQKDLPGKPDIILKKYKTVIFVHGCYWHRHDCKRGQSLPSSNKEFWKKKFQGTIERDEKACKQLKDLGWNVGIVWQCELKNPDDLVEKLKNILGSGKENKSRI